MQRVLAPLFLLALLAAPGARAAVDAGVVVDGYFEAYSTMDVERMLGAYAPDAVFVDVAQRHRFEGGDGLRQLFTGLVAIHREMGVEIQRRVVSGELVVVDYLYQGTLSGEALRAATGKETCRDADYRIPVTSWFEVRDGKIRRQTDFIDMTTLGEVRAEASGAAAEAATP